MKKILIFIVITVMTYAVSAQENLNLLRNANFAKMSDKGSPADWRVYGKAEFKQDNGWLKITVKDASENVSISQKLKGLPANTKLLLSGKIKSSKENLGYIQIKLKIDKKELERKQTPFSTQAEKEVKLQFSSLNSNNVTVIVRFSKERQQLGDAVWVKDMKLTPLQ